MMTSWSQGLERFERCEVDRLEVGEQVDELFDNETLDIYVPHKEPSDGPLGDYETYSEKERLMRDNIKIGVEVATRRFVPGFMEDTVED